MKKQSEKVTEKKFGKAVKKLGGFSIKLETNLHAGLPDRLVLIPIGTMFFVEFKSEGNKPSKLQTLTHILLRKIGFDVHVIDTIEKANKLLEDYA